MAPPGGTTAKTLTDHRYRDYSRVAARELLGPADDAAHRALWREDGGCFPAKLHAILSRPEYVHIVRWMPHGRAWRVADPARFRAVVMPRYFDAKHYQSFKRSVNGWGFKVGARARGVVARRRIASALLRRLTL